MCVDAVTGSVLGGSTNPDSVWTEFVSLEVQDVFAVRCAAEITKTMVKRSI